MGRERRRSGPSSAKPIRRLGIAADEEIDLHGCAVDEALVLVEAALRRHQGKPGTVLRFIHGHSSGMSGSIKGALLRNLGSVWKSRVEGVRPEPGNAGATLVKLR